MIQTTIWFVPHEYDDYTAVLCRDIFSEESLFQLAETMASFSKFYSGWAKDIIIVNALLLINEPSLKHRLFLQRRGSTGEKQTFDPWRK